MEFVRPFFHIGQSHAAGMCDIFRVFAISRASVIPRTFPDFSAVILNAELIQCGVFPDGNRCFAGIAVPHDIGECQIGRASCRERV